MASHRKLLVLIGVGSMALALSACGGNGSSPSDSSSAVLTGKEGRPDVPVPVGSPPTKLVVEDIEKGSGSAADDGDEMSVRYFRFDYKSHRILEDHWKGRPTSFTLGSGQLVDAWEKGLSGIRAGGRRELVLPAKMTFAKAAEIYVIDALSVKSSRSQATPSLKKVKGTGAKPKIEIPPGPPPKELVVRKLKAGSGGAVRRDERLGVRYVGINYETGRVQDSWGNDGGNDAPYSFVFGEGDVRKGWEIGLKGMKLGARWELLLPSRLAYGDGAMRYVIELLEREKPKPKPSRRK